MACCSSARAARALVAAAFSALLLGALALILWLVFGGGGEGGSEELGRANEIKHGADWLGAPERASAAPTSGGLAPEVSIARREEERRRELPAGAILIRVVDERGEPAAGIPVGLIDIRAAPLPFFALARLWNPSGDGGEDPEPPKHASQHYWTFERGVVRRVEIEEAVSFSESEVELLETHEEAGEEGQAAAQEAEPAAPSAGDFDVDLSAAHAILDPTTRLTPEAEAWMPPAERPTLWFADAFHWRGTTDEHGEAVALWDRTRAPDIEVAFAFPTRAKGLHLLSAFDTLPSTTIQLVLPPIARAELVGVHDLDVRRDARWKARIAARGEFRDGEPAWVAWDDYAMLGANGATPLSLVWERGLPVRVDAYLDAPFAPLLALSLEDTGPSRRELRSAEHYAGGRVQLFRADGADLALASVELQLCTLPDSGAKQLECWTTHLDVHGRCELVLAARTVALRGRELRVRDLAPGAAPPSVEISGVLHRDPLQDRVETHFQLDELDLPGQVRDLSARRFGEGPELLAGRLQWSDGSPIVHARVYLPRGLASDMEEGTREALRTDQSGAFRRLGIPRTSSIEVEVLTGSFGPRPRFTVEAGQRDLLLQVPRRGVLAGRVVFERPQALEVFALGSDGHAQTAEPNAQGEFAVRGLAVGPIALSIRAGGVELWKTSDLALSAAQLERPGALQEIDLREHAHLTTLVLRDPRGAILPRATVAVKDPAGGSEGYRFAGATSRTGELRLVVPRAVAALVVAVPGYRDQEVRPLAGRVEVGLLEAR
ncbi:MAG: carboxypeptidase regulatory-like domain-containing protein [Planctomycetes bacterium]|nr:carboxypeptidase regulatory-like domain-containing protein [Planctomycetota bacterium]